MPRVFFLYYRQLSVLSLDVTAGTLIGALFFARVFSVRIGSYELLSLGLTVWIIYTMDHLRDAKNILTEASTKRHRFHQEHFSILIGILVTAIIFDAVTILFIDRQVLGWGIVLASSVLVYLVTQRSLKIFKELFIAILYTCGILLPSVAITEVGLDIHHYLLISQFGIVVLINLLMFSWFDRELDYRDNQYSFVILAGLRISIACIWFLFVINGLLLLMQLYLVEQLFPALILGVMGLMLMLIFIFRSLLTRDEQFRLLGDAIFLLPVFYI